MGILSRLKRKCEKEGIIEVLQFGMRKAIGVQPWKEEIDTCFYFLNKYVDARTLPPTDDPDLRILQLCDVELLKIFDKACRRLGLEYWLDWGTLLGAVRHKGFIPWDDDMDVAMPRKDFCRADTELKAFMETFGIDVTRNGVMLGIGYKHAQTGIWLDVFPADVICSEQTLEEARGNLDKANKGLYTYFRRNREVVFEKSIFGIRKYFNKFGGSHSFVSLGTGYEKKCHAVDYDSLYPLATALFETGEFKVPVNTHAYLKEYYGRSYMQLPHTGIELHGVGYGRALLSQWAKINHVDMKEILDVLRGINNRISVML